MSGNIFFSLIKKSAVGAGAGIIITSVIIILFAAVLSIGNIPTIMVEPFSVAAVAIGAFSAGFSSAKFFGEKGLVCGFVSGLIFLIILWIFGGILGESGISISALFKVLIVFCSSSIGGIIGVNTYKIK